MTAIALKGFPIDAGAAEPGASMGPAALRIAGLVATLQGLGHAIVDHGDLAAPEVDAAAPPLPAAALRCRNAPTVAAWIRGVHDAAYALADDAATPVFLGGDHALSAGTVSAMARRAGAAGRDLHVLWLDAHADFNTPSTSPTGNLHGMALAFACGEPDLSFLLDGRSFPALAPSRVHLFGLRSTDGQERAALKARGVDVVDMRLIDEFGVGVLMQRLIDGLDPARTHLHVSLDVDFLDPALAPGVGTTVPGGATYREAHLILEMLHDSGLVRSLDVVELNPFLDLRGQSAKLLVDLLASLFGRRIL